MSNHLQQLLLVRRIAREADRHVSVRSDFDNGLAVSLMQDAVELLLWAACSKHGVNPKGERASFDSMLSSLSDPILGLGPIHGVSGLAELNKARVNFKHYGLLPHASDAMRLVANGRAFIDATTPKFFNVELEALCVSDTIHNTYIREPLKSAETALDNADFKAAMYWSRKAVFQAGQVMSDFTPEPLSNLTSVAEAFEAPAQRRAIAAAFKYLVGYLDSLRNSIAAAALSIDPERVSRFKRTAPTVVVTIGGHEQVNYGHDWTEQNARFCVGYAQEFAEAVERRVR